MPAGRGAALRSSASRVPAPNSNHSQREILQLNQVKNPAGAGLAVGEAEGKQREGEHDAHVGAHQSAGTETGRARASAGDGADQEDRDGEGKANPEDVGHERGRHYRTTPPTGLSARMRAAFRSIGKGFGAIDMTIAAVLRPRCAGRAGAGQAVARMAAATGGDCRGLSV